ncbi:hypothetical protein KIN20_019684 [Parelaphostrongylus tenuis]|uniref:Uncharacterized protein n=1 Tax=Parelaphostrongylus tenuis TaxID=148309 RepID=A0AAD5QT12_PARTN|nr:hypothetical protein KIN20_019684 [Parelaphostrongylus tenuis]
MRTSTLRCRSDALEPEINMAVLSTASFIISLLATISAVLGCGVMPPGQMSTRTFTVTGFSLRVAMVYTEKPEVSAQVPGIASGKGEVQAFVQRLVMQTFFDVLERQARSALLPDAIISVTLGQLTVNISYDPLDCSEIAITRMEMVSTMMGKTPRCCIIVSNTVTGICIATMTQEKKCDDPTMVTIANVANYTSISGTLSTTNIIMANWSRMMWQDLVNRAVRMLASAPFGSHFFSASSTVGGN